MFVNHDGYARVHVNINPHRDDKFGTDRMSSTPEFSPVLFVDCNGEPIQFYIRPGPAKAQLHDVIIDGGGVMTRSSGQDAIHLLDPKDLNVVNSCDKSNQVYVSTQYVWDCVSQNQQLDEENYRLTPPQRIQTRSSRAREGAVGRMAYTASEDEAILGYISERLTEARGNTVWQQMEKLKLTSHSWQSMKDRYLRHLKNRPAKSNRRQLEFVSAPGCPNDAEKQALIESRSPESPESVPNTSSSGDSTAVPTTAPEVADEPVEEETPVGGYCTPAGEPPEEVSGSGEEKMQPSPKRPRQDVDDGDENQDKSDPGGTQAHTAGPTSAPMAPTTRRLGILDRAAFEFRSSLLYDCEEELDQEEAVLPEGNSPRATSEDGESATAKLNSCNTHLFMFDTESQEDCQQPSQGEQLSTSDKEAILEGEKVVLGLMHDCKKGLVEVTKALLRTNGDIAFARHCLLQRPDSESL